MRNKAPKLAGAAAPGDTLTMLRRMSALNYKCLRYIDQTVAPFQVLVGPNASGKSAFLDVVRFVSDLLTFRGLEPFFDADEGLWFVFRATRVEELIFNQASDKFEFALELAIPERLRSDWVTGDNARARYELCIGNLGADEGVGILSEALWLYSGDDSPGPETTQPTLFPLEPSPPPTIMMAASPKRRAKGWRMILNKRPDKDYFRSETSDRTIAFRVGRSRPALAHLPEEPDDFPVGLWVRDTLQDGVMALTLDTEVMRQPASPSRPSMLEPDGRSLPLVIRNLKRNDADAFRGWLAHVQTVLPEVEDVDTVERPEDKHVYLRLKPAGGAPPIPSWLLSDGTLRFLALTLLPYLPTQDAIYLIEEPENGIHPKAIEAVFDSLSSVYDGHVSLATHSPLIVSLAAQRPEQILCFAKTPSGATAIVRGDQHPALKDWDGRPDLSVLYASGVLG